VIRESHPSDPAWKAGASAARPITRSASGRSCTCITGIKSSVDCCYRTEANSAPGGNRTLVTRLKRTVDEPAIGPGRCLDRRFIGRIEDFIFTCQLFNCKITMSTASEPAFSCREAGQPGGWKESRTPAAPKDDTFTACPAPLAVYPSVTLFNFSERVAGLEPAVSSLARKHVSHYITPAFVSFTGARERNRTSNLHITKVLHYRCATRASARRQGIEPCCGSFGDHPMTQHPRRMFYYTSKNEKGREAFRSPAH
jgi:hypothetical protein